MVTGSVRHEHYCYNIGVYSSSASVSKTLCDASQFLFPHYIIYIIKGPHLERMRVFMYQYECYFHIFCAVKTKPSGAPSKAVRPVSFTVCFAPEWVTGVSCGVKILQERQDWCTGHRPGRITICSLDFKATSTVYFRYSITVSDLLLLGFACLFVCLKQKP